jgi:hypothetical protein
MQVDDGRRGIVKWKIIRDTTMFIAGLMGFVHEVIVGGQERPTLLFASLALMGVPFFLRKDEDGDK